MVLQRRPGLRLELEAVDRLAVVMQEGRVEFASHGLAVLDAFARPIKLSDALNRLQARGREDWMRLSGTIMQMIQAGVLFDVSQTTPPPGPPPKGFGGASVHIQMLNDRRRTAKFIAGIKEVVRPGDVVVDVGTGSGVLAAAAAQAGAARVYAIEASEIADVAQAVFRANNVDDRVTLIRGWSTQIDLPERADVMVSEIIGNDPFDENILAVTHDARQRLLKPNARILPNRLSVYALPLTIPARYTQERVLDARAIDHWHTWYGLDLSPLSAAFEPDRGQLFSIRPQHAADWSFLASPILLADIDLANFQDRFVNQVLSGVIDYPGLLNGMLIYFETQVGSQTLSTHPHKATADNIWRSPVWWLTGGGKVVPGDRFALEYQFFADRRGTSLRLRELSTSSSAVGVRALA